ncbi:MAG: diguanylate cyclase [Polyangiaceae bacterium]|nr:diguanylate cyclase [Polyangiaceae bacterium]
MSPLLTLMLWVRRAARFSFPAALAISLGTIVVLDASARLPDVWAFTALGVAAVFFAQRLLRRMRKNHQGVLGDIELGALLAALSYGLVVRFDHSLDGRLYPIVLSCVGVVGAFGRPAASVATVMLAAGLEIAVRLAGTGELTPKALVPHLIFLVVFGAQNAIVLRAEIARLRKTSRERLETELSKIRDDARSYRLLGTGRGDKKGRDDDRLVRSGVEEIHQAVLFALKLLRESLDLYTAVLLWRSDAGTHLRISELSTDAPNISDGPFLVGDGIFGAAISQGTPVALSHLKPNYKLPYYSGPCPVRAVLALPLYEHGTLRGLLVVDRALDKAFSQREIDIIDEAGRYALRAIQNERVFVQLERAKVEQGKLYRAAETLGAATTEADVISAGVTAAREITSVDYAAITIYDEKTKAHEIRAVSGGDEEAHVGQTFRHNAGLVSMVVQNRHPLPYRGEYDEQRQIVFTKRLSPPSMPSIVVLPLCVHDRALGAIVLGSKRPKAFGDGVRGTLEVLASHMAVSLANARMVKRLEELATLDGLTGLFNKRAMLEMAEQKIVAAKRFHRRLSVLVADIDHFKKVNDTHGHDVGDIVIKGLGEILRRAKRNTDAVARFGGEEFVVICEETDARGAMLLAERVREELKKTVFHVPGKNQTLSVTCSIGVATFPDAGQSWDEMFKAADDALYVSKRSGRDRSTAWSPSAKGSHERAA